MIGRRWGDEEGVGESAVAIGEVERGTAVGLPKGLGDVELALGANNAGGLGGGAAARTVARKGVGRRCDGLHGAKTAHACAPQTIIIAIIVITTFIVII